MKCVNYNSIIIRFSHFLSHCPCDALFTCWWRAHITRKSIKETTRSKQNKKPVRLSRVVIKLPDTFELFVALQPALLFSMSFLHCKWSLNSWLLQRLPADEVVGVNERHGQKQIRKTHSSPLLQSLWEDSEIVLALPAGNSFRLLSCCVCLIWFFCSILKVLFGR